MSVPLFEWPKAVDWNDLEKSIYKSHGFHLRDVTGRNSPEGMLRLQQLREELSWSEANAVFLKERPEQDYWYTICDDINRNGINYLNLSDNQSKEDWVKEVERLIKEEVKDSPAYNPKTEILTYYVDW